MAEFVIPSNTRVIGNMVVEGDLGTFEFTGDEIKLPNQGTIRWRNVADSANLTTFEVDDNDILIIGGSAGLLGVSLPTAPLILGAIPAATGTIRLSNADAISWRNFNNNGDITVFGFSDSDVFRIGEGGGITQMIVSVPETNFSGQLSVAVTNGQAFRVGTSAGVSTTNLNVDTSGRIITLDETLVLVADKSVQGQARTTIQFATAVVLTPSGATATAVGLIPAGAIVLGVTTRNINAAGPAGYDVGDGVNTDRWGNSISTAPATTSDATDFNSSAIEIFPVANDVVITSDGVDFTGGQIRVYVHYMILTAPVS
jgi:hypothetical protein